MKEGLVEELATIEEEISRLKTRLLTLEANYRNLKEQQRQECALDGGHQFVGLPREPHDHRWYVFSLRIQTMNRVLECINLTC